jgi:hypothetical protein
MDTIHTWFANGEWCALVQGLVVCAPTVERLVELIMGVTCGDR